MRQCFPSPDPEKLSKAESVTEEAISLLLIGSVLTVNKESHCHQIKLGWKMDIIFSAKKTKIKKLKNPTKTEKIWEGQKEQQFASEFQNCQI